MIEIELTMREAAAAAKVGVDRNLHAIQSGLTPRHGCKEENCWDVHIEGACGELAVAKALNVYWHSPLNTFKRGSDVGKWQVRTRSRSDYDLIVRSGDSDHAVFILVTGRCPKFRVIGWMRGGDAKKEKWLKTHGGRDGAYFVPQAELNSDFSALRR